MTLTPTLPDHPMPAPTATTGGAGRRRDMSPDTEPASAPPRRPPPGRLSPQALADARGGALEGLAWLGRTPEARASVLYRLIRLLARFILFGLFRFRIET